MVYFSSQQVADVRMWSFIARLCGPAKTEYLQAFAERLNCHFTSVRAIHTQRTCLALSELNLYLPRH